MTFLPSWIRARFPLAFLICFLTILLPSASLLIWTTDVEFLPFLRLGYTDAGPLTAICFIAVGGVLTAGLFYNGKWRRHLTLLVGVIVLVVSAIVLARHIFGSTHGLSPLVVPEIGSNANFRTANEPNLHSTINFLLIGASLVLLFFDRGMRRASELAALLMLGSTFAAILDHLYHVSDMNVAAQGSPIAKVTILSFLAVGVGLLVVNPNCRFADLLSSRDLGGTVARRLLPVVIIIPSAIGFLRVLGQEMGLYSTGAGTSMSTLFSVLLMFSIVLLFSEKIHRSEEGRKKALSELAEKENRYRELFDYSQGLMCIHDLDGKLMMVNQASLRRLGYDCSEMVGHNLSEFVPIELLPEFSAYLRKMGNEGLADGILYLNTKNGEKAVLRFHNILVTEAGQEPYVLGHSQDVTDLLAAQEQLRNLSLTDELSGLYNRRGFLTIAEQQLRLERHSRTARGLTLFFADMDGLKKINDTIGHEAGSEAIQAFSQILRSEVRGADIVARWGGDEFVILSIGANEDSDVAITERIREGIDLYNRKSGKPFKIACSIGTAPVDLKNGKSFEEIVADADLAMYESKRRKKADSQGIVPLGEADLMHDSLAWY